MNDNVYTRQPDWAVLDSAKGRVLKLLQDRQWHTTAEINAVGGTEGTRRVRDLRAEGFDIEVKKFSSDGNKWKYRLAGCAQA